MDSTVWYALAGEFAGELRDAIVKDGSALSPLVLSLELRHQGTTRALLLSAEPGMCRMELLSAPARAPAEPSPGEPFLARLRGARLAAIECAPWERIIRLRFVRSRTFGGEEPCTLLAQMLPARPAIALLDENEVTLALLRPGSRGGGGREYALPPRPALPTPDALGEGELARLLAAGAAAPAEDKIRRSVFGLAPTLAREIAHRAGMAGVMVPPLPSSASEGQIEGAFRDLLNELHETPARPRLYLPRAPQAGTGAGPQVEIALVELTHLARSHDVHAFSSVREAAAAYWREVVGARQATRLEEELAATLRRMRRRSESLEQALAAGLEEAHRGEEARRRGELLVAHLGHVTPGESQVVVPDAFDPAGGEKAIPLDPSLSPQANVARYFRLARKAERARNELPARLAAARQVLSRVRDLEDKLAAAASPDELLELQEEIERDLASGFRWGARGRAIGGAARRRAGEAPGQGREAREGDPLARHLRRLRIRPRQIVLAPGWVALIGRSSRENDLLTTRVAAPHDLWFHARGAAGSHLVLIRPTRDAEPPSGVIERAAQIAAFYSQGRTSSVVAVAYTEARYVRKPRGAAPGLVTLLREKVIMVAPAKPPASA